MSGPEDGPGRSGPSRPDRSGSSTIGTRDEERPESVREWAHWAWTVDRGAVMVAREIAISASVVLLIGLLLFGISGVWPPMVAIESGSMSPNMHQNDLVFISAPDRFANDASIEGTGIVPADEAERNGYSKFGEAGDVIVFTPNGNDQRTPIIHRAELWVEEGEDWYDRADPDAVGAAGSCDELQNCPAPHDGFITKGDNEATNTQYDQVRGQTDPVKPEWVLGTAELRVPYLGWVRLQLAEIGSPGTATVEIVSEPTTVAGPVEAVAATDSAGSDPVGADRCLLT
ncbi:S26 family signal peptidase [Natronorarus salvus]|uniref:S26 family signal peptidase n=1 Tax=Natronorarus salvus TaxID=3117733 RepID=UPI002F263894